MKKPEYEHILSLEFITEDNEKRKSVGYLAQMTDTEWLKQKAAGNKDAYLRHIKDQLKDPNTLPAFLTTSRLPKAGRRQPSFVEASLETVKRLEALSKLTDRLPDSVQGVLCGGSMAYGRFFSVRGNPDPSDIDLLYIVKDNFFEDGNIEDIFSSDRGFANSPTQALLERARKFGDLYRKGEADLMSQKLVYDDFLVSAKLIPEDVFRKEFVEDLEENISQDGDRMVGIRDYKEKPYSAALFTQYNFLHTPFSVPITEKVLEDGTAITTIPSFFIQDGHFYTGDHHNHVLPGASIEAIRDHSIEDTLAQFQEALTARAQYEQMRYNRSDINVLNAQDRMSVFSPQKIEEARYSL